MQSASKEMRTAKLGPSGLKRLLVFTSNFPMRRQPHNGAFVEQFIQTVYEEGVVCYVVHPMALHRWPMERLAGGGRYRRSAIFGDVYEPRFLSMSNRKVGALSTLDFTRAAWRTAALRAAAGIGEVDAVYGHFLYAAGEAAVECGRRRGVPRFVAVGESIAGEKSSLWSLEGVSERRRKADFQKATGIIAVSEVLRDRVVSELGVDPGIVRVFPNGVDCRVFWPRDRAAMRARLNLPQDRFLVGFVGAFNERKGTRRLAAAIEQIDGIGGVFLGSGPEKPLGESVITRDPVPHSIVPEYLSAVDVFALPSTAEGSSNATLEAMACGLPIIASDRSFNDGLIDQDVGIRVDPLCVKSIQYAIETLRASAMRRKAMGEASLRKSQLRDIRQRARSVLRWMQGMMAPRNWTTP